VGGKPFFLLFEQIRGNRRPGKRGTKLCLGMVLSCRHEKGGKKKDRSKSRVGGKGPAAHPKIKVRENSVKTSQSFG